jgi:hypothetical protein
VQNGGHALQHRHRGGVSASAEAGHGDLGIYTPGDPTVLISKNGSSQELRALGILRIHDVYLGSR